MAIPAPGTGETFSATPSPKSFTASLQKEKEEGNLGHASASFWGSHVLVSLTEDLKAALNPEQDLGIASV